MTAPATAAGRALRDVSQMHWEWLTKPAILDAILAIEAEARQQERERIANGIEPLLSRLVGEEKMTPQTADEIEVRFLAILDAPEAQK